MNARSEIKRYVHPRFDARRVLAAAQLRLAAAVDRHVARWLERCAADIEAAQGLFKSDRKPGREYGMGAGVAVSSSSWIESP
jgi:hypothetical protein